MAGPELYYRTFNRTTVWDVDTRADADYLSKNFTDFFGRWLQQGTNANIKTLDGVLTPFWSVLKHPSAYSDDFADRLICRWFSVIASPEQFSNILCGRWRLDPVDR
jgi:hypothetical protein